MAPPDTSQQSGGTSVANIGFEFSQAAHAASALASIIPQQILALHPSPSSACKPGYSLIRETEILQSIGAGLTNLGNTCFLNAVLQCLTYTPPLAVYFFNGLHQSSCKATSFCAMCALESHVKQALSSHGLVVSPSYIVKNLKSISRTFQMWRQEDAHEYMRYLIEALQKSCSIGLSGTKSLIENIFGGQLRSQVKCTQCLHCSNTYDPFLDLSLEVVRADSLQKAFSHFTAVEVLDGDNKYQCSKCKAKVRAQKQFTIDKAPIILTVQFKRFSKSGTFGGKIDKKVHFDRTLDLSPFVSGGEEQLQYSLYAVLVHSGWSTHSGHYYCFVRTANNTWHVMDDSKVSPVSERTVLEQKAYILFYMRNCPNEIASHCYRTNRCASIAPNPMVTVDTLRENTTAPQHEPVVKADVLGTIASKSYTDIEQIQSCTNESDSKVENQNSTNDSKSVVQNQNGNNEPLSCVESKDDDVQATLNEAHSNSVCNQVQVQSNDTCVAKSECESGAKHIMNDTTTTTSKANFFEAAGQYMFRILCMCAKLCFWSCLS